MDSNENKHSSAIAFFIIVLITISIIAVSLCIYFFYQISSLQNTIEKYELQITEYQNQIDELQSSNNDSIKSLFYAIDDYICQLEEVSNTADIGTYEKRRLARYKENVWTAMNELFNGIPNTAGIKDFANLYFD